MSRLSAANILKQCWNEGSSELLIMTTVLFKVICIRNRSYCLQFEYAVVQQYIACICHY